MNDYDHIAPFYDIEHARFGEDIDMYCNFAELSSGKILELACGSGRLLLPLANHGYEVVGVDSSEKMLELAQKNLAEAGLTEYSTLVKQDICTLNLEQKFRFAFIALGSFAHLTTRKKQRQALASIHAHLSTGATFIIDISNADARYMEELSGQILHQGTWQDDDDTYFSHFVSSASSTQEHLLELTHFYDRYIQGGAVQRNVITTSLYLFERSEMELLLEQAGFVVKNLYGDHELGPFSLESPRMIFIAEAR